MEWILYGATGVTGRLITQTAVRRGHRPILAGRNAEALRRLAEPDGLTWRTADLDDEDAVGELVAAAPLTLLAASTFNTASLRLARACLAAGAHYLDLANEVPVLEAVYGLDDEARARGCHSASGCRFWHRSLRTRWPVTSWSSCQMRGSWI